MNSRDKILSAVKNNQPALVELVSLEALVNHASAGDPSSLLARYIATMQTVKGYAQTVAGPEEIIAVLQSRFPGVKRMITSLPELQDVAEVYNPGMPVAGMGDIDVAILTAHFAVAENAAVWITDDIMIHRAIPFVVQHLMVVVPANAIVATMHDAYRTIGNAGYGYGAFIAGPSKTADIEQALVLGAHGPLSMTVLFRQE